MILGLQDFWIYGVSFPCRSCKVMIGSLSQSKLVQKKDCN